MVVQFFWCKKEEDKPLVADKLIVGDLITGLAVALAFFICTSIVLPLLAVYLYPLPEELTTHRDCG